MPIWAVRKAIMSLALIAVSVAGLTSCAQEDKTAVLNSRIGQLEDENRSLREQIEGLKKQIDEQQAQGGSAAGAGGQSSSGTSEPGGTTAGAGGATTPFPDIAGVFGEKDIQALRSEGVLDVEGVNFEPAKSVTRAEFIRWLMKKHNAPLPPGASIHPASPKTKPAFADVPSSDPDFKYIQAMHDAGWSIGFADGTFHPTGVLTREQLLAMKAPGDKPVIPASNLDRLLRWPEGDQPHKPVTRAEAAVCLANMQNDSAEAPGGAK